MALGLRGIYITWGYTVWSSIENFSAYSPVLRGFILLPHRHPHVFARMARWQLSYFNDACGKTLFRYLAKHAHWQSKNNNLLLKSKSELNFWLIFVFRLISELIQLLQLLSVINIVQLKQWNRLFCWILNFALSLGIFFVRPDCFLVRSGLVSDLTNDLLIKKNYLQPWKHVSFLYFLDKSELHFLGV